MDCRDEHERDHGSHGHDHGHDHGHGHDGHDHVPPPDTNEANSLYQRINHDHIVTLNESEPGAGKSVFKKWEDHLDTGNIVESDVDEQLIITVPFTGLVRLHSVLIRTAVDDSAPKTIKLFKNRDDIDFSTASDLLAAMTLNHPSGVGVDIESPGQTDEGIAEYAVSRAKFSDVTSLTLFVEDNHGAETTRITYIGLRGEWSKLSQMPVVTLYEAAANPRDHKNIVPGEYYVAENP